MSAKQETFSVRYAGLPEGSHVFDFVLNKNFFIQYHPDSEIIDANIQVHIEAERAEYVLQMQLHFSGNVTVECDRCLDPCSVSISSDAVLLFTSENGRNHKQDDDSLIEIAEETDHVVLDSYLYDFSMLSIPIRRVHDELDSAKSACNKEMLSIIEKINTQNAEDSRWDQLKKIKFEN